MAKARSIKGIDCKGSALAGIRLVLNERFAEMYALQEEVMNWEDPEGVHSMRVASRRLRGALRDFRPFLNGRKINSTVKKIRSLADALGEVRDQDVAILALENLSSQTTPEVSTALQKVVVDRQTILGSARDQLKESLLEEHLRQLESEFRAAVEAATDGDERSQGTEEARSFIGVARLVINERLSELEKLSNSLYTPLDSDSLHAMRIAVKRLRYAIELFHDCFGKKVLRFSRTAARLQDALGNLHDCDVWIEGFGQLIRDSKERQESEYALSYLWLFKHFMKLRSRHFQKAFAQWRNWETKGLSNKLRETLKTAKSKRVVQSETT
jgi:CHAD domain-containing protein